MLNLADKGDTDQGAVAAALASIFSIEVGFVGSLMSNLARLKLDSLVDEANASHLAPWLGALREARISNTPLSPFLHKQLLLHNALHVDGSAAEAAGFVYAQPNFTTDLLKEAVVVAVKQGIFPPQASLGVAGPAR